MGVPGNGKSVHNRVSTALERLERLERQIGPADAEGDDHLTPETVEEAVRRLKVKVPDAKTKVGG